MTFVLKLRPVPLLGAVAPALACFIALETIFFNILSVFSLVTKEYILGAHIFVLLLWTAWVIRTDKHFFISVAHRLFNVIRFLFSKTVVIILLPICILLLYQAFLYPPNTWDSMTYHMGRVAHWIQWQSVDYFPTNINRQNEMGPGAEYLILFLQLLTGTDFLANLVQLFSFFILIPSLFYLLKIYKIAKKLTSPIIVLTLTTPMLLFQAVTTQNDLVASVITFAIIIVSSRLLSGDAQNIRLKDYSLLGICIASGFLVKPTSLIVAAPFIVFGVLVQGITLVTPRQRKKTVAGILLLATVIAVIAGPDIWRKAQYSVARPEVYPLLSNWNADRLANPVRITGQNTPWPGLAEKLLRTVGYKKSLGSSSNVFNPNQDFIGNPVQLIIIICLTLLTLLVFPLVLFRLKQRAALFCCAVSPLISWILFGFIVKNQPWISRLQLPIFLLLPCSCILLSRLVKHKKKWLQLFRFVLSIAALFSTMFSFTALAHNKYRPLLLANFWGNFPSRESGYYIIRNLKPEHDLVIKKAVQLQCRQVGLLFLGDTWDYPLTWRLMAQGTETRHVLSPKIDEWPCMLYQAEDRPVPLKGLRWLQIDDTRIWYRNLKYEFNQAKNHIKKGEGELDLAKVIARHAVDVVPIHNGIAVQAIGDDPYIVLPYQAKVDYQSAVLKLFITSSKKSSVQIFYMTDKKLRYSQRHSIIQTLFPGENELYFFLPINRIRERLRLDFGISGERYEVHSAELRPIINKTDS